MKPEFHEDYSNEHNSPQADPHGEFDWQSLEALLGEARKELSERDYAALVLAINGLAKWILRGDAAKPNFDRIAGRRMIALAWVLCPSYLEGNPSLTRLAKTLGISTASLSMHTAAVTKTFGITNNAQAHGWNRKKQ